MITCETCEYGLFCPTWGEWRCTQKYSMVLDPVDYDCPDFKEIKNKEEKPCHCQTCMERGEVED